MSAYDPMPIDNATAWGNWARDTVESLDFRARQFHIQDPRWEGPSGAVGVGNANADTYAINAALTYVAGATAGREKALYFGGGKHLRINSKITWPAGIHFMGGPGSEALNNRKCTFRWDGTAGGDMFECVLTGDRVIDTLITEAVFREGTNRPGRLWVLGDSATSSGVDFGTMFYRVSLNNFDGDGVDIRFGPTNFFALNFRADNFSQNIFRIAVNNAVSHVTIGHFTADNTGGVTGGGRLLHLDGTSAGNNKSISAHIFDGKYEINTALLSPHKTLVLATMDPTASQAIQHRVRLSDIEVALGGGVSSDYSIVKARRTDDVATRYVEVEATNMTHGPGLSGRLIDGVTDPHNLGSFTGKVPNWSYSPQGFGFATPGAEGILNDYQTQTRFRDLLVGLGSYTDLAGSGGGRGLLKIHNALANPTANPVGGGYLYVDTGALKYRGTSGTVTTIANA